MKATSLAIERRYSDDSGVKFGVSFDARSGEVTLCHIDSVSFPAEEIQWLIDALYRVKAEVPVPAKGKAGCST
jgi:hypothetical protein